MSAFLFDPCQICIVIFTTQSNYYINMKVGQMKALQFEGSGLEYFKIWIVNILLIIVTLGMYYPWAKVRTNRYFYANSTLEGRNFEYHATGKQLFIGYLISMVLFIAYSAMSKTMPIGSLLLLVAFFLALPWIIWRSMRFRMRMSSYSNVRFGFVGTVGQAYINYLLFPLIFMLAYALPLLAFTIGPIFLPSIFPLPSIFKWIIIIAAPLLMFYMYVLIKYRGTNYMVNGSRYGQGHFNVDLDFKTFAIILVKAIGLSLIAVSLLGALLWGLASVTVGQDNIKAFFSPFTDPAKKRILMEAMLPFVVGAYALLIPTFMAISAYIMTRQRTYIYANSTLDGKISFASTLKARSLAWVNISNLLLVIVTLGFGSAWAKVRLARLMQENTLVDTSAGFDDYLTHKQAEEGSIGDQIGDAFDVDVGIGF